MKYLIIIILVAILAFFLASNKDDATLKESIMSVVEKVQTLMGKGDTVDTGADEQWPEPIDTTRYVRIMLSNGETINGRLDLVTQEEEHKLSFPYGKMTIKKEDIVSITDLIGDEKDALKHAIEQADSFKGTGKAHTPILPYEEPVPASTTATAEKEKPLPAAPAAAIKWEKNISTAKSLAAKQSKLIMMDFSTSWCGWCTKLDEVTFADANVSAYVNEHFIALKLDGDKENALRQKYNVRGFPNIVCTDATGKMIHQIGGFMPPQPFLAELKKAVQKR
jgi:thioredoxin-related protein